MGRVTLSVLIAGSGPSRPAESSAPGHVDGAVVDDLAAWVKSNTGRSR